MLGNERKENLLEAILMAAELGGDTVASIRAAKPEDSATDISDAEFDELEASGFLVRSDDQVALTEQGMDIARRTMRRHRLSEMLLFSLLGVERELATEIACKLEHGVREEMLDSVCTLMGHPTVCPHGRPIPPGKCCESGNTTVEMKIVPLSALKPGERGTIVYVQPRSHERMHHLSSLGLNPGVEVTVHQRSPAFCIRFEETDLAMEKNVAMDIHVSRLD